MADSVVDRVRSANTRLHALLTQAKDSLAGRARFNGADVRAMTEPIASVRSIVDDAESLRAMYPDLAPELESYKGNLEETQRTLEQMRVMLAARRAHVQAARGHLATLGMWNATLRLTR